MQPSSANPVGSSGNCEVEDPISQKVYFLEQGFLCSRFIHDSQTDKYPLAQHFENEIKARQSLGFKKLTSSSLVFGPSGKSITCKSDKIHEVDMNISYTEGVFMWALSCSSNCLSLIVGVKNAQKKKEHSLEFTVQSSAKIVFKLDIPGKKLKAWIDKSLSVNEKKINLSEEVSEWTPFIRIKGVGVTVFVSDLVEDPEGKVSVYNIFGIRNTNVQPKLELNQKAEAKMSNFTNLKLIDPETLLLFSNNQLRVLRREKSQRQFNLSPYILPIDNKFYLKFSQCEIEVMRKVGFAINGNEYCGKTTQQWTSWVICAFTLLDTQLHNDQISKELYCRVYEILLSKCQAMKGSIKAYTKSSAALQSDLLANWGSSKSLLPCPTTTFKVPNSIRLNNEPSFKLQKDIKNIIWTQHFIIVQMAETERLIVLNREDSLFRVAEINLKRGFKKQYELNQYQKELDLLQSNSPNEPSIYKILKNCLKYADKIKIPEKEIKEQLEKKQNKNEKQKEKKQDKKSKKVDPNSPDKSLVNTLLGMGFNESQANTALIHAKNNLEKAIQFILTQPQKQAKSPSKVSKKTWDCPQCTLLNEESFQICQVCEFPKPPVVQEAMKIEDPPLKQEKKPQKEKIVEENVESKNIQSTLQKIFAYEIGFAYCPLIIAGAFEEKLRIRLFGPNPKYYSMFYNKDEEFVDLANLTIHNHAYQIDQKPVRHQFYLSTSLKEQKESAYGWISIEDADIDVKGTITKATFKKSKSTSDKISFTVQIESELNGEKLLKNVKILITIDQIYAEKMRSVKVENLEKKEQQLQQEIKIPERECRQKHQGKEIPLNGYLQVILTRNEAKNEDIKQIEEEVQVEEKINYSKSYMPVIACHQEGSAQVTTLISAIRPGQKPLILKHLQSKAMSVEYVVLQKIGKNPTSANYRGFIWFSEDPSKKPVRKIKFRLEKGRNKFYIHANSIHASYYVCLELIEEQKKNDSIVVEEIALVGVIGEQFDRKNRRGPVKIRELNRNVKLEVKEGRDKPESSKYKIETELINSDYDLNALPGSQLHETIEHLFKNQSKMGLCVKVINLDSKDLWLESLNLQGWSVIRQKSIWSNSDKSHMTQQGYKTILDKFLQTCDLELLDSLGAQEHKDFLKTILSGKYNLTKFINAHITGKKIQKGKKNKLITYFHQIGPFLQQISKDGNFDYESILKNTIEEEGTDVNALQFVLELGKFFPVQQTTIVSSLLKKLNLMLEKEKSRGQKGNDEQATRFRIHSKEKPLVGPQNTIYSRFLVQNGKLYRKFTIDMINVYKVTNFVLNFERSQKRLGIKIVLKSCTSSEDWKVQYEQNYPEFVWEQLTICPYTDEFQKNMKQSKKVARFNSLYLPIKQSIVTRYLELEICFSCHPNLGSNKAIENIPHSEITPQIHGTYFGEAEFDLEIFNNTNNTGLLTFVKNIGSINKFSVNSLKNTYYYDSDQVQSSKNEKDIMSSHKNEDAKLYFTACAQIDELIARGSDQYPEQALTVLLNCLSNLDRSPLLEKIIILLRKIAKTNQQAATFIYKRKLPSEHAFNSILRQSSLTSENVVKSLENSPSGAELQNSIYFAKGKQEKSKDLFNTILKQAIKSKRLDDTITLHQRHGWAQNTEKILDLAIEQGNKKVFRSIVSLCKDNKQLAKYVGTLLKREDLNEEFLYSFEELMSKSRNLKQEDAHQLLESLIKNISQSISNEQSYDESQISEKFSCLTSALNQLHSRQGLVRDYIKMFGQLPHKQNHLNKFLSLKQFKNNDAKNLSQLINLCIKLIEQELARPTKGNENLTLIYEIMIFIIRTEGIPSSNSLWVELLAEDNINQLYEAFGAMLIKELCFGGESNSKLIDGPKRLKLSIGFCLANLITKLAISKDKLRNSIKLSDQCVKNIIKWLLLNENTNENDSSKTINHFLKLEEAAWVLLVVFNSKQPNKVLEIFREETEKHSSEIRKIKNRAYQTLFDKKMLSMYVRYLDKIEEEALSDKLIEDLFPKFMQRVIGKDVQELELALEADKSKQDASLTQKEYANSFELQNQPNKPKDWLLHKNGAKNNVLKFQYPKGSQNSYELLLKLAPEESISLSKILIGFEQSQTAQESYCVPREITVEGGMKVDELKFIGKLVEIPDSHYINYSVRVYGLNCAQIQSNKLSSSLNKYPETGFIKLTFRCPEVGYASDVVSVADSGKSKNFGCSINFLSVQAYSNTTNSSSQIEKVHSFIQKISEFRHKESLKKLFSKEENVKIFKDSLINLSTIIKNEQYSEEINKFIMRVCEVNTQIGNQTIQKYLHLGNSQTCSKIVSEVILSDPEPFATRVQILFNFINKNLESIKLLEPFLNKFCQIIYTGERDKRLKDANISFTIDSKKICLILKSQNNSTSFAKFLCTLMRLQNPFTAIDLDYSLILQTLFQSKVALNKQTFEALVVSEKNSRSWFMKNSCLENLTKRVIDGIKSKSEDVSSVREDLQTLSSLCYNNNIKSIINKNKYNLEIFNLFVSEPYSKTLVGEQNASLRQSFVNFIIRSVLGSQNQKLVAQILKQSLTSNSVDQNKYFVGQVFLPILNSYAKTTICVHPYNKQEEKILMDVTVKNAKGNKKSHQKIDKSNNSNKFRLPTNIINGTSKSQLFQKIQERTSCQAGNFNLVASHSSSAIGVLDIVEKTIKTNNQSMLFLFKVAGSENRQETLGIYYKQQSEVRKLPLYWNEQCLMFIAKQKEPLKFLDVSKQVGKKFITIFDENGLYDLSQDSLEDKIIELNYENVAFCQICHSSMFGSSYINLDVLRGTSYGQYKLQTAQYWVFQPASSQQNQQQKQQSSLTNELLNIYNISFFERGFESRSVLRLLRSDKIYQFPSSLTFRQLKLAVEVMKCRLKEDEQKNFKMRTIEHAEISNEATVQSLGKKNEESPILDLLCETTYLTQMLDFNSEGKGSATVYLPKKGIMKHFEEINGVTSMIKVIKKSLEGWKNKERKEKWLQYVMELEKFSSFPHFFGMYLKDSETFDLLFKLLSGLPDTEQDKKWDELETKSTQKLLKIISEILSVDKTTEFRQYAMKHDFFFTILERLKILTGQFKREWKQIQQKKEEVVSPSKQNEDDGTKQIKKKKGVGYGNDGSSNTKWMKGSTEAEMMKEFEVTELILNIIENFLDLKHWNVPKKVTENMYESALLPYLEDSLRAGTLLQISKIPAKFRLVFKILRTLSKNPHLVPILMPINKNYHPRQIQSLQSLLKSLQNTANIFLSCLKPNKQSNSAEKVSEQLSKDIIATSKQVQQAIQQYVEAHHEDDNENEMKNILELPLDKKYRTLLKDLRFDYIDMKEGAKIKHHYSNNFNANYVPNQNKMIRLAQQLADISTALPYEHTNAIFVRCDKDRVDFMQALIMGSNGTPYGHGAYLFDIYFDDSYPSTPPKVNLTTTGHAKVRFNPNLYACGKVCLSLLGTWRGSASENWDPKVSTLLQVLVSIQAIIMSEEIYFNQPGFQGQQGTPEGQKKNEAYSNIVRYCNIKFAMIDNMKNPPKGFEHVIKRHFYLKQHEIMEECKKWLLYAEKRPANYIGLVNDHNNSWSTEFKKTKNQYKEMLEKAIEELDQEFKKLPVPSIHDITSRKVQKKQKKKKQNTDLLKKLEEETQEEIDVEYENKNVIGAGKQIDINDEKVKDRWSRYIGAMGIDAVSKQSKADILIFGLGPMALEVIKNLVLSGCRKLTIVDEKDLRLEDLSGGFFYGESDVGKKRIETILYKIRQLNAYVKVDTLPLKDVSEQVVKTYNLVFVTQMSLNDQYKLNEQCRKNNVRFISADFRGAHCRVFNDFGDKFEVLDKNGQQPVEVIIKDITIAQNGIVTLLDGVKTPFEDGEVVHIRNVQGMNHKDDKTKSINGTLHKVKALNTKSFQIGDTTMYEPYIRNGLAKNVKTPIFLKFKSMKQVFNNSKQELPVDENLSAYDFSKMARNKQIHFSFVALNAFVQQNDGKLPGAWDLKDAQKFAEIFAKVYGSELTPQLKAYVRRFSFTCSGYLPPLSAYLGGFISQQIIKAITQKYKPLNSVFYMDAEEIIPQIPDIEKNPEAINNIISKKDHRDRGFEIVAGKDLLELIKNSSSFMIGSGAIGCQLLKNFAMVGLGTGEKGKITITDPDHIENSNLNRQFLFREKHISKPKSKTAAASVVQMNQHLKGHISALLERVSESTKNIFSNKFFESLTFVANALDNVAARRYVDQRCVENKVPLFESGTLGPKGHTQVILPFKTQSYGSQSDPVEDGEIPHCTLKMFPEQTLHCVQWARDIFGKKFSLQPKAFNKIKDPKYKPEKDDIKSLSECMVIATKGPKSFQDCVNYAITKFYKYFRDDIMQLLYTYPLDAKTKDGQPFWKLPKRPPAPIMKFDPENILHCTFIASMAVLVAKVYKIPFPKNFREEKERLFLGKEALKITIPDFIPSDEKAKSILKETADQKKQKKGQDEEQKQKQIQMSSDKNEIELHQQFIKNAKQMEVEAEEFEKDNDQNGHIDFIYSMANLRALNYKLDAMDWITTKLKAGRIVPALATTTTCVAGLQTLEICKYIKNLKLESMRNSFLNLAGPSLYMSEPGEVKKIKINDKVEVNLWDRWQLSCDENTTFGQVYSQLKSKYGLYPIGVLQGMSRIDTSKTEQGKKQFLASKLLDRLDKQDDCIDIIVLFTSTEEDDKMIENIPPVRLKFDPKKA